MTIEKNVDNYIENAADYAKPILRHLRKLIHRVCPDVKETIKWGMPYFEYKGILCNMAAFQHHCAFGFWKASLMKDAEMLVANNGKAMGHSGKLKSRADLPPDSVIIERIKEAMHLNEEGIELPSNSQKKIDIEIPEILQKTLNGKRNVFKIFNELASSHKKEYVQWVNDAKTIETKMRRSEKVVEMILNKQRK